MPIPTSDNTAVNAAERLRAVAKAIRADAVKYVGQCDAGSVNAHDLVSAFAFGHLQPAVALWATLKAVSGVAGILRQMFPGTWASDAACLADLDAAEAAMVATRDYVVANTPKDAGGWVLTLKANVAGTAFEQRVVTNAPAIAALRTQLVLLRDAFTA